MRGVRSLCLVSAIGIWAFATPAASRDAQVAFDVLTPPGGRSGDGFGRAVAISGTTLIVGAHGDDECGTNAGAAYVYIRNSSREWVVQQKLAPASLHGGEFFGWSVSIDGDVAVVGAPGDRRLAVGASYAGAAHVFRRVNGVWTEQQRLAPADLVAGDAFGWQVAISGEDVLVTAAGVVRTTDPYGFGPKTYGIVYAFRRAASAWVLDASSPNGQSVDVSNGLAAVGAYSEPTFTFQGSVGRWSRDAGGRWTTDEVSPDVFRRDDEPPVVPPVTTWIDGTVLWLSGSTIMRSSEDGHSTTLFTIPVPDSDLPGVRRTVWTGIESENGVIWVAGHVYSDSTRAGWVIWRRSAGGTWSLFAQNPAGDEGGTVRGLESDQAGGLYVLDGCAVLHVTATGEISRLTGSPRACTSYGTRDGPASTAQFNDLLAIALAGDELYVVESLAHGPVGVGLGFVYSNALRRIRLSTAMVDTIASPLFPNSSDRSPKPAALTIGPSGVLWIANRGRIGFQSGVVFGGAGEVTVSTFYLVTFSDTYFRAIDGFGSAAGLTPNSMTFAFGDKLAFTDCNGISRIAAPATGEVRTLSGSPCLGPDPDGWLGYDVDVRGSAIVAGSPLSPLPLSPLGRVGYAWVTSGEVSQVLVPASPEEFSRYGAGVALTAAGDVVVGAANGCVWVGALQCENDAAGTASDMRLLPLLLYRRQNDGWQQRASLPTEHLLPRSGLGTALATDGDLLAAGAPEWDYQPPHPATGDTVMGTGRVLVYDLSTLDTDHDGLPDTWEERFGLDPLDPADGGQDTDGDGVINRDEYARFTHPNNDPRFTRYFAEGATSDFFATRLAIVNPGERSAAVSLQFMNTNGTLAGTTLTVAAHSTRQVEVNEVDQMSRAEFSTMIESDQPIAIDRLMTWSRAERYGSHGEHATVAPSPTWYLAEGATHSGFDLFYLLQNPSDAPTTVRVRYLRAIGPPLEKTYLVGARSRSTIWVNVELFPGDDPAHPALSQAEVSAVIESLDGAPIVVERAMYLTRPGHAADARGTAFEAGHGSAGIVAPSTSWFFAEGATGDFFDEFILLGNSSNAPAHVRATYLLLDGQTYEQLYTVAPASRFNIWLDEEQIPADSGARPLANLGGVSVTLDSDVPIVAERAMWWPGPTSATWTEAHDSAGATQTAVRWAAAAGQLQEAPWTETYYLVANPTADAASVRVTLLFGDETAPVSKTFAVASHSRFNVNVRALFPEAEGRSFGAVFESVALNDHAPPPIIVEWAVYSDALNIFWAAGANALATPWP